MKPVNISQIAIREDISLFFTGPPLEEGPLPAFFYFSLSGEDSLTLDPFNQPVAHLAHHSLRIFSIDIPGHGKGLDPLQAMSFWARELQNGVNIIADFIDRISIAVDFLLSRNIIISNKIGVAGLSRGAFIACHAAAKISFLNPILGFAPLTRLAAIKELEDNSQSSLDLIHLSQVLTHRKIRFYIGNRDKRVGTSTCFNFVETLVDTAFENSIRSPQIELFITPSIGYLGHGTSKQIFEQGAEWIWQHLSS